MLETRVDRPPAGQALTVSALLDTAKGLLEDAFPVLLVEGEVSNLARPGSGHLYFTLKDDRAQIRCALFRNRRLTVAAIPRDGQLVRVRARLSIYSARGDLQLIVEHVEDAGEGALRRAFEALRARLQTEGLFDTARKRPLPKLPKRVAVITSSSGAAVRDVLQVMRRRFAAVPAMLYPVAVQGAGAVEQIVAALARVGHDGRCDVAILTRGGGSLEDLQAFNDERVARAVASCAVPVVVGVGHEVDVSIADFAADLRAPTPSAAAELVVPDSAALESRLRELQLTLSRRLRDRLAQTSQYVDGLEHRLATQHPSRVLKTRQVALDHLRSRLTASMLGRRSAASVRLERALARLGHASPRLRLRQLQDGIGYWRERLRQAQSQRVATLDVRLKLAARSLDAVSPLATLARGYAIVTRVTDGELVRSASQVTPGEQVCARLATGALLCEVREQIGETAIEQEPQT